jgi:sulfur carrier protein
MPRIYRKNKREDGSRMKLIINSEAKELSLDSIKDVVEHYQLTENLVVTEVDGTIINQEDRASTKLIAGMRIEIVQFVGGG